MYIIKKIELVGGYAIKITWGDGHDEGLFSWDYLKNLVADSNEKKSQEYDTLL